MICKTTGLDNLVMPFLPIPADLVLLFSRGLFTGFQLGLKITAENDIGSATSHICGNGDRTRPAGLGN